VSGKHIHTLTVQTLTLQARRPLVSVNACIQQHVKVFYKVREARSNRRKQHGCQRSQHAAAHQ
jgi:hypothetical protein